MKDDAADPWIAESLACAANICERDHAVARAAELPAELSHHGEAALLDVTFSEQFDGWLEYLFDGPDLCLLLAIEQSCNEGVLLPWDMRAVRLDSVPNETLASLHWVLGACPRHVLVHLAHYAYWMMRSERARRRGRPAWSPSMPLPELSA